MKEAAFRLVGYAWSVYFLSVYYHLSTPYRLAIILKPAQMEVISTHYLMACSHGYIATTEYGWDRITMVFACMQRPKDWIVLPFAHSQPYRVTIQSFQGFPVPFAHCTLHSYDYSTGTAESRELNAIEIHTTLSSSDSAILSYLLPWICIPSI